MWRRKWYNLWDIYAATFGCSSLLDFEAYENPLAHTWQQLSANVFAENGLLVAWLSEHRDVKNIKFSVTDSDGAANSDHSSLCAHFIKGIFLPMGNCSSYHSLSLNCHHLLEFMREMWQ